MKWFEKAVFYQIYTFGFCGAPLDNDNIEKNRIKKVIDWIQHLKNTGIDAIYFCPIFDSDRHGYDIRDYRKVDCRIGTNEEFKEVCNKLKENNISIVLDAVFNHTGKQFWAFQDVKINRENSKYKDWFYIDFSRNSADNLGFYYEGWEGHFELVKLNLKNPEVKAYLIDSVKMWMNEFNIDGLRLDVAYMLDTDFMIDLRKAVKSIREDFFLLGETIHGDYNKIVNDKMLDSSTNYQAYKGLFSSFNDKNFFEIAYTLNIHFGQNGSYKGKHLFSFADNHDVNRLASVLKDKNHLPLVYAILFSMPGIPCIYYGSEWGAQGMRTQYSDKELRPCFDNPQSNDLTQYIAKLIKIRKENDAFIDGSYNQIFVSNFQFVFERNLNGAKYLVCINCDANDFNAKIKYENFRAENLLTGEIINFNGTLFLPKYCAMWLKIL